ncbi:MAG: hypothetical protein M1828_002730 [Chrysothrix sp. TS-e1954]|nr:MAG: hypothetical protein M1828_002730 [Chrysothrix sp. TS-e1954]
MWSIPSFNTLLSLPLLSVFLLPSSATSYTTSLNLFFFYLTWSTILFTYRPIVVELVTVVATRVFFFIIPCAGFLAFDLSVPSLASSFKANGPKALPFRAAGVSGQQASRKVSNIASVAIFNVLLGAALQTLFDLFCTEVLNIRGSLKVTRTLPLPWTLAKDLTISFPIRGISSYYIHRYLLHSPRHSPTLTRWHTTWAHSLRHPMPFSSAYDHPAVYLLHRWLPTFLPLLFFRIHILSYLVFNALIGLEEAFANSGYNVLPSTIVLAGMARRQEAHLLNGGAGNFAPYGILDFVLGTTVGGNDVMDDAQDEARKHDVQGKANKAAQGAEDMLLDDDDDGEGQASAGSKASGKSNGMLSRMRKGKK